MSSEESLVGLDPKWLRSSFYLFLLIWASYLLLRAQNWPSQDRLFPLIIGGIMLILIPIYLLNIHLEFVSDTEDESSTGVETSSTSTRSKKEKEKHAVIVVGWVTVFFVLTYLIGFAYAIPLFVFFFLWFYLRDLKTSMVVTLLLVLFLYILFIEVLNLKVWQGILDLPRLI